MLSKNFALNVEYGNLLMRKLECIAESKGLNPIPICIDLDNDSIRNQQLNSIIAKYIKAIKTGKNTFEI